MEDQVVAILHLSEEQAMLTTGLFPLPFGEKGSEAGQPLLAAGQKISRAQRISEFLEPQRITALQEGIRALLEVDSLLPEPIGQPVCKRRGDESQPGNELTGAVKSAIPASRPSIWLDTDVVVACTR